VTVVRVILGGCALALSLLGGHSQIFFLAIATIAIFGAALWLMNRPGGPRQAAIGVGVVAVVAAIESGFTASSRVEGDFLVVDLVVAVGAMIVLAFVGGRLLAARPRRRLRLGFPWIVTAVVALGCALAAVQIGPLAAILGRTRRESVDIMTATTYSFSPSHLPLLLFPYLFGNNSDIRPFTAPYTGHWTLTELAGYPGLACLVLAAAGIPRFRRDPRALALVLTSLVLLLVALGASSGAAPLVALMPIYGNSRSWARYIAIFDLTFALLAGYGVAHLRAATRDENRRAVRRAWVTLGALVALGVTLPFLPVVDRYRAPGLTAVLSVVFPLGAAILAALACMLFARRRRLAGAVCCLLVAADGLVSFGAFYEWRTSPSPAALRAAYSPTTPTEWGRPPASPGGIVRYLYAGKSVFPAYFVLSHVTDVKGIRSATGYDPLAPAAYLDALGNLDYSGITPIPASS
jgi:hypothetical protein